MKARFTNRQLAEATGYSHGQVRRWTVAFLPPDNQVGQHAGVSREHSIDEAFKVILGGKLVFQDGLSINDARLVVEDIVSLMKKKKWLPSNFNDDQSWVSSPIEAVLMYGKSRTGAYHYELKTVHARRDKHDPDAGKKRTIEEYEIESFGDRRLWVESPRGINLIGFVRGYLDDLEGDQ